jgi:MEDS: MEthanogen/methylotroph, DcmR Sensory domain/STAS domain
MGRGADDLYSLATTALAEGARRNEKLMFVADAPDVARLQGIAGLDELLSVGQLELAPVEAVYGGSGAFSPKAQLATFEAVLADALAAGYTGIRVVADNTSLATGDDAAFHRWLRWEQVTDRFQSSANVTGICYFDGRKLSSDRRADLAAIHPVRSVTVPPTPFSFVVDGDAVLVTGALDFWSEQQFRRLLRTAPDDAPLTLDLSHVEFVDHRALLALNAAASHTRPVRISHATHVLRQLQRMLAVPTPHLRFE